MNKQNLQDEMFNKMLELAVKENYMEEIEKLPSEESLRSIYSPSAEFDQRMMGVARKKYWKIRSVRFFNRIVKLAASIVILIAVSGTLLFSVKATRIVIFNTILDWKDKYVTINYKEQDGDNFAHDTVDVSNIFKPSYLPEGFYEDKVRKIGPEILIKYVNQHGIVIYFEQVSMSENHTLAIDSENKKYSEIEINNRKARIFESPDAERSTFVIWDNGAIAFNLYSTIDKQELIKIAESIKIEK